VLKLQQAPSDFKSKQRVTSSGRNEYRHL